MIAMRFAPKHLSTAQYEEVKGRLAADGGFPPDGMLMHICFGEEGSLRVTEGWRDEASFEAFAARVMPMVEEAGIELERPEPLPVAVFEIGDDTPGDDKGIVVRWEPEGLTRAQYDAVNERLSALHPEMPAMPPGLCIHALIGEDGEMTVGEVWSAETHFRAFKRILQPALREVGVRVEEPMMWPCHSALVVEEARHIAHA